MVLRKRGVTFLRGGYPERGGGFPQKKGDSSPRGNYVSRCHPYSVPPVLTLPDHWHQTDISEWVHSFLSCYVHGNSRQTFSSPVSKFRSLQWKYFSYGKQKIHYWATFTNLLPRLILRLAFWNEVVYNDEVWKLFWERL